MNISTLKRTLAVRGRALSTTAWFAPALLALAALLAFGLLLPRLGLYWDDWAKLLVGKLWGLSHYAGYYAEDRPLSAWTHIAVTPLLGYRPLAWQVFTLGLRWLAAWGFFACLERIWPDARFQNLSAALLFLVYPAFTQQPASVTFFQQWMQYALFFFSLYAMLRAAQAAPRRKIVWSAASLAALLLQLSITEYFAAAELVRPLALWLLLVNASPLMPKKQVLARAIKLWLPYLAVLAGFAIWRLFLIRLPGSDPHRATLLFDLLSSPGATISRLAGTVWADLGRVLVGSWTQLLQPGAAQGTQPFALASAAVGIAVALLVGLALMPAPEPAEDSRPRWVRQALVLGAVALALGPLPAWITGLRVVFDAHSDRFALPALFGASLIWAAVLNWVAQKRLQRVALLGLLLALAVSLQLRTANDYRWNWTAQQRFYWQLWWRAPGLEPSTALVLPSEPFEAQGLFSTSAAANLLYPQPAGMPVDTKTGEPQLGYWVYTLQPRFSQAPDSFDLGLSTQFRTFQFNGKLTDSLLLYNDPRVSNCLWLLSARDENHPLLPELVKDFLPISSPGRILTETTPGFPPADLFGREPERGWCYYFEKADLARQLGNWEEAARLGDEARSKGFTPASSASDSPYEWLPFIESYARTGKLDEAKSLSVAAFKEDPRYGSMLCEAWKSAGAKSPGELACGK